MSEPRETDAERVQRAVNRYINDRIELRQSCLEAMRMAELRAVDRVIEIMHQKPEDTDAR